MIREPNENAGKAPQESDPRSLLRAIERHLAQAGPAGDKKAYEAQQCVYDAWEAPTDERERQLIAQALALDPMNVDALLQATLYAGVDGHEEIEVLRKIVAAGVKNLGGERGMKQFAGGFWGFIETRPYMRARQRLAEALRVAGRIEEAVAEWEGMLELNPNDNQGVRYSLLPAYLELKRLDAAERLFAKYDECQFSAVFSWGKALGQLLAGDLAGATKALRVARKQNPHMQAYITGSRKLPRELPDAYAPGSKEEAICFADVLRAAWKSHPEALRWLSAQK